MAKRTVGMAAMADNNPMGYVYHIANIARYDSKQTLGDLIGKLPSNTFIGYERPVALHWVFQRNPLWWAEHPVCHRDDHLAIFLNPMPQRPFSITLPDGCTIGDRSSNDKCFRHLRSAIEYAEQTFPFDEPMPVLELHHAAFRLVVDPNDWKAPIDAHLSSAHDLRAVIDAIGAYTGYAATVLPEPGGYHITADGARWSRLRAAA